MFRSIMDLSLSDEYLGNSVRMLCQMLERHHGRRAIVLIDEYDRAITNSFDTEIQRQVIGFFGDLLSSTLKGNRSLQMAYDAGRQGGHVLGSEQHLRERCLLHHVG